MQSRSRDLEQCMAYYSGSFYFDAFRAYFVQKQRLRDLDSLERQAEGEMNGREKQRKNPGRIL